VLFFLRAAAAVCAIWLLVFATAVQAATLYAQPAADSAPSTVNSNRMIGEEGSDQDVTAYDAFTVASDATVTAITWRGEASETGFTITIHSASSTPAHEPDLSEAGTLATISAVGAVSRVAAGNGLFDYRVDLSADRADRKPFFLKAGGRYWISIVSSRPNLSVWGWGGGTGGDGKTLLYYRYRHLAVTGDRAFSLSGEPATAASP
jgi:hypothetical protein